MKSPIIARVGILANVCGTWSICTILGAEKIRVVLDSLSTHSAASLYTHFAPPEAQRIMRQIEFHYTPKHGSWSNMVEIEIGVIRTRLPEGAELELEIAICQRRRNSGGDQIH